MFTGIIEEIGTVLLVQQRGTSMVLQIEADTVLQGSKTGDSIAVNGVCLTVTSIGKGQFEADVMPETFRRSSLSALKKGSKVNLERAMAADGRFGGHIVAGHVDGTGVITDVYKEGNAVWVTVEADTAQLRYIVEKGSIAIDGISLTVAAVDDKSFKTSVIPHTGAETTLLHKKKGDLVNLECDVIGKYVEKLLGGPAGAKEKTGISREFLEKYGF